MARWIVLFGILAIHLSGIFIFCLGFFPSKVVLQGYGEFKRGGDFQPQFKKTVFVVVDALRSDFVFSDRSSMNFVQSLLSGGSALGFTAYSNPPTVTLPRLKGITTGSTPNFLDAVLNVVEEDSSSSLAHQDSWLKQLKRANKRIHMYGDDTWVKLFPGVFDESEGTGSFFVSDFTEVDNNVTRHLDHELKEQNWDCLILHYLGLDHIGHKGGPESIFMKPKQKEMDGIIERIYNKIDDDTLLVLLGDHGMNDIGNHGGSSAGETSAALVFISDKLKSLQKDIKSPLPYNSEYNYYQKIQQIDLVPTLSLLLHLPIPKNSLGIFIREFLDLWGNHSEREAVLLENVEHLKQFKTFLLSDLAEDTVYDHLKDVQSDLTRSATNYDLKSIYLGLSLVGLAGLLGFGLSLTTFSYHGLVFTAFTIIFGVTAFGSSLVEEEHQIWWWIATLFASAFCYKSKSSLALVLVFLRIVRGWNNSGQKFVGDTIYKHLQESDYTTWALFFITISVYAYNLNHGGLAKLHPFISFSGAFMLTIITLTFKLLFSVANGDTIPKNLITFAAYSVNGLGVSTAQESLVHLSKLFYFTVSLLLILRISLKLVKGVNFWFFSDLHNLVTFILIFQSSVNNIGIFLVLLGIKHQFGRILDSHSKTNRLNKIGYISLITIVLQNLSFFSFGQTNSLATVDLSNAYNGIESYNIFAVGLLTFISNFTGPIYWSFGILSILYENKDNLKIVKYEAFKAKWTVNLIFYTWSTLAVLGSCYIQRYHLFVWTVFSPKVLYTVVWNFFINGALELFLLLIVSLY